MASKKRPKQIYSLTEDSLFNIHTFDIDIDSNQIYLFGREEYAFDTENGEPGVEYAMANKFIRNLNTLIRKSEDPILIHMKTCGGFWEEGMAIYDAIKACPNYVAILSYTHARSMSSIIFQAADKRIMMPNSTFMFHDGEIYMGGTVKQFLTEVEQVKANTEIMMQIYVDSMKESDRWKDADDEEIKKWLRDQMDKKEDVHLNAEKAIEHGFADEIFSGWEDLVKF